MKGHTSERYIIQSQRSDGSWRFESDRTHEQDARDSVAAWLREDTQPGAPEHVYRIVCETSVVTYEVLP